jgi:hypothetical protein
VTGALPKYEYHGRLEDVTSSQSATVQHASDLECSDELSTLSSRRNDSSLLDAEMEDV